MQLLRYPRTLEVESLPFSLHPTVGGSQQDDQRKQQSLPGNKSVAKWIYGSLKDGAELHEHCRHTGWHTQGVGPPLLGKLLSQTPHRPASQFILLPVQFVLLPVQFVLLLSSVRFLGLNSHTYFSSYIPNFLKTKTMDYTIYDIFSE